MNLFLETIHAVSCTFTLIVLIVSWVAANLLKKRPIFPQDGIFKLAEYVFEFLQNFWLLIRNFADQRSATSAGGNKQAVKAVVMDPIAKMMGTPLPAAAAAAAPPAAAAAAAAAASPSKAGAAAAAASP
jgi:hypothetical protein